MTTIVFYVGCITIAMVFSYFLSFVAFAITTSIADQMKKHKDRYGVFFFAITKKEEILEYIKEKKSD